MFDSLTDKLNDVFKKLKGQGKLSEGNIDDALKTVRLSLLEADVNFRVVKGFIKSVKERAIGTEVMKSLTPGQQFVKVVHEELILLLGEEDETELNLSHKPPVPVMMVGLQGSGKTTTCGKLAYQLKKQKRNPFLVPADVYRPAAIQQLKTLGRQIDVEVWDTQPNDEPVETAQKAIAYAEKNGFDVVIIDTAGRLHVDGDMMAEVEELRNAIEPKEILFVADAMTGQDAVQVAKAFNDQLEITGVVLTKMDGDARGGAALSIRSVTQKPIKLVGLGEKMDRLERFYPERIASRILGMGDVLSLIEKAQENYDEAQARALQKKIEKNSFTLEDFLAHLQQLKNMGPLQDLLEKIPGVGAQLRNMETTEDPEKHLARVEAIICSMTKKERRNHMLLNASRKRRIARGSGTSVREINELLKQFVEMRKMMKKMQKMGMGGLRKMMGRMMGR